ncbi:MAG: peptide chain release factor 1 [Patescibacteria group bacterium]|nr:peptide chain release factor 1 [Patescibacteria group bacterium]
MKGKIKKIQKEYEMILSALSEPAAISDPAKRTSLNKRSARLQTILAEHENYKKIQKEIRETETLLVDPELKKEAEQELQNLKSKETQIRQSLEEKLNPPNPNDVKDIIMEIRAGAGGDEAGLFAADLFRMYSRYTEQRGWEVNLLNSSRTGIGGFKEIIFEVNGSDVFSHLKYESGVHRVQRIPETEKSGRIHTSTASVAVLPQAEEVEIKIKPENLRVDVYRSSGPGGQSVNTTDSAVRITYLPTGLVVSCQDQKSQLKNKEKALQVLRSRLLVQRQEEGEKAQGKARRAQIGGAKRAEKIRTYNFPQDRITDHRIKKSWHGIERIMNGEIDDIIQTIKNNLGQNNSKS